jgi:hypothetical protein
VESIGPASEAHKPPAPTAPDTTSHPRPLIDGGPPQAGVNSACWRSPMIQPLSDNLFGVFDTICYIAQVLKYLGLSYQKAALVSAHLNDARHQE